jgi:hypothetical protein
METVPKNIRLPRSLWTWLNEEVAARKKTNVTNPTSGAVISEALTIAFPSAKQALESEWERNGSSRPLRPVKRA